MDSHQSLTSRGDDGVKVGKWVRHFTKSGKEYFYNVKSHAVQLEKPRKWLVYEEKHGPVPSPLSSTTSNTPSTFLSSIHRQQQKSHQSSSSSSNISYDNNMRSNTVSAETAAEYLQQRSYSSTLADLRQQHSEDLNSEAMEISDCNYPNLAATTTSPTPTTSSLSATSGFSSGHQVISNPNQPVDGRTSVASNCKRVNYTISGGTVVQSTTRFRPKLKAYDWHNYRNIIKDGYRASPLVYTSQNSNHNTASPILSVKKPLRSSPLSHHHHHQEHNVLKLPDLFIGLENGSDSLKNKNNQDDYDNMDMDTKKEQEDKCRALEKRKQPMNSYQSSSKELDSNTNSLPNQGVLTDNSVEGEIVLAKRRKVEALQKQKILEIIFSFLDSESIKAARQVNPLWSVAGAKILFTKCYVKIPPELQDEGSSTTTKKTDTDKFKLFLSQKSSDIPIIPNIIVGAAGDLELWKSLGVLGQQVKSLKLNVIDEEAELLQNLLDLLPNLKHLNFEDLSNKLWTKSECNIINTLTSVMSKAEKSQNFLILSTMSFSPKNKEQLESIKKLAECKNIMIEELEFSLDPNSFRNVPNIEAEISSMLGQLLSTSQNILKILSLENCEFYLSHLEFPCLMSLTKMALFFSHGTIAFKCKFASSFRFSKNTPNLQEITPGYARRRYVKWPREDFNFKHLFDSAGAAPSVKFVTDLPWSSDLALDPLFEIFPNTDALKINVEDLAEPMFHSLWTLGGNLKELYLVVEYDPSTAHYFEPIFTGLAPSTLNEIRDAPNLDPYTLEEVDELRVNPSILNLKELDHITIQLCVTAPNWRMMWPRKWSKRMLTISTKFAFNLLPKDPMIVIYVDEFEEGLNWNAGRDPRKGLNEVSQLHNVSVVFNEFSNTNTKDGDSDSNADSIKVDDLHRKVSSLEIFQKKEDSSQDMKCPICQEKSKKTCPACKSVAYCGVAHQKLDWKDHKKVCQPFSIEVNEDMGTGCVATRDLKAGLVLLEELPVLQAPAWEWKLSSKSEDKKCLTCGIKMFSERTCSTCSWPVCSDGCEKNPLHLKNECKELALGKVKYPPPKPWQVGMLVMFLRAKVMKARDPMKFKQLMALRDFYPVPSLNEELKQVAELPSGMFEVLEDSNSLDLEEFQKLLRICKVNELNGECESAPSLEDEGSQKFYNQLYFKGCQVNHSCIPNCEAMVGRAPHYKFKIHSILPVSKGEQLTLNLYTRKYFVLRCTVFRQEIFKQNGRICKCKRCLDPTELGTFLSGIKCISCSSHLKIDSDSDDSSVGFLVPADPLDIDTPAQDRILECHHCHVKYPFSQVKATFPKSLIRCLDNLKKLMRTPLDHKSLDTLLTQYEEDENLNSYLHKNHWRIQIPMIMLIEHQRNNLDTLTMEELERFASRFQHRLTLMDKLCLGSSKLKRDDLTTMYEALELLLVSKFRLQVSEEQFAKWLPIYYKAH